MRELQVRGVTIPADELVWTFTRSGGPGGQHANTSDTAVELRWDVVASGALDERTRRRLTDRLGGRLTADGVLVVRAGRHRSQLRNREDALARLAELVDAALAPPPAPRRPSRPSRAARQRRLDDKRRRGQLKALRRRPPEP